MSQILHRSAYSLAGLALLLASAPGVLAQSSREAAVRVTQSVNESEVIARPGNIHPAVFLSTTQDLGPISDDRQFDHMYLQLQRTPDQAQALQQYLDGLADPKSEQYHKWGTAARFAQQFGLAQADIDAVKNWLQSHGLAVNAIYPNLVVDFSGAAKQVSETFHTSIHNLSVNGTRHFANISNPQIPAALASVVMGPVALHDFKPRPLTHMRAHSQAGNPNYTTDFGYQLVVPLDLQKIYNMNPLYSAGISGQGQTVVLLERTNLYSTGDFNTFRKTLGLARAYPNGKLVTVHPPSSGTIIGSITSETCSDPGVVVGDDSEAAVDVEWASASSPNATVELASCADTDTNFGAFIALENLLTAKAPPPAIMSLSYGSPESENGTDGNAYINSLYQLAVYEGVSLFVSTGDADADVTDQRKSTATHGINVNALASTPNNVAVGGTDFADSFLGETSTYWSSSNGPSYNSAQSYIPEIPWNDSCASQLVALSFGYLTSYGSDGFCNSATGSKYFLSTAGGSGGPSGCAYGEASIPGAVSGTCSGYAKPFYQKLVFGNPADGVRDLPDVSLFAANGVWGHYYVLCYTDAAGGGVPCNTPPASWNGAGGTSFAAPIMAGIQSLINQATGSAQGNPDRLYYLLAAVEYGTGGSKTCDSTLGNASSPTCIFHDITFGDNNSVCSPLRGYGSLNCYYPATNPGQYGVQSTSNTSYQPAFPATFGYDFATGIGSVDAYNLVANWPGSSIRSSAKR